VSLEFLLIFSGEELTFGSAAFAAFQQCRHLKAKYLSAKTKSETTFNELARLINLMKLKLKKIAFNDQMKNKDEDNENPLGAEIGRRRNGNYGR
jgi:hypothetical protein